MGSVTNREYVIIEAYHNLHFESRQLVGLVENENDEKV